MRKHLHKLFAISMAMALGLMAQAQTQFQAVVPSGQTLNFKTVGATTCGVWYNDRGVVGDLVIPETVEHEGTTYRVTSMVDYAFEPSANYNDLTSVVIPSSITYLPKGAFWRCDGLKSVWLPPTLTSIGESAFRGCKSLTKVIIPASVNSIGSLAFASQVFPGEMVLDTVIFLREDPPTFGQNVFHTGVSRTVKIWSPLHRFRADNPYIVALGGQTSVSFTYTVYDYHSTPAHVNHIYDTIHPGESRTFAGRILTAGGDYTDSTWYYTHDSLITLHLTAVPWHFYANAPTGQRLYYHITGTDSVEVVAPNGSGWAYYTPPTDSLAIPATVTHDGHTYSVFRIANRAFYRCDAITALTLPEGIAEVGTEAIFIMTSRELRVSLPRSLRIINDYAFNTNAFNTRLKLASDTIWAEVIGREAFFPKVISQPIVLPNVRSIADKGFYRIGCPYLWVGDSCTSIGEQAFAETTSVPIGSIPGRISLGTSLQSVGASAFSRPNGRPIHSVEFRGTTVPSFAAGVFKNTQIDSIITPCGTSAAYRAALDAAPVNEDWDPSNTVFQERGCPVNVYLYDTLFYAMGPVTFAGRSITSPGEYRDTIHLPGYDSINILVVSEAHYSFSVDTLGNRLWYRIIGTDRVAVVPPNTLDLSYSGYTEPSGNLDIPDTVRHGGTAYAVVQLGAYAFYQCYSLDGYISLPPTIDTIGYYAFSRCSDVKKLVIPASVNFFNDNCFLSTMTAGQNDTLVFLGSDASRLSTWTSMFGYNSRWDSKILVPCGSMAAYSAVRGIPAAYLQEYGCTVVVHIYDTMCVGTTYHWANKAIISGGTFYDTVHLPLYDSVTILHLATEGNWNMGGGLLPDVYCETSLPFAWHGQYIDAPGDYTHDERVLTSRGCWLSGKKYEMTVFQRPHTYIYDTVRSTAKGYDYSDTTETTVPVNSYPCRDSLVTTITWHDLDETTDTVRTVIYDTACAGSFYRFGGRGLLSSGTYYDTVHMPFRDSITILHLNFEGSASVTFLNPDLDCESSLPFTWHGQYIDAPGNYTSDERVFSPRGCYISGEEHYLRVVPLPHTYLYDTVVSAAKGNDYSDTVTVVIHRSMPVMGATCIADSLVTTITWHDLDETTDTVRTILYDTICAGTIYHFGSRYLIWSDTYYDTVRMPFRDSITVLHLEVEGTMANSLHTEVICETSLPYIWDGDTITTPGTHHLDHSVFNPRGCLMSGSQLQLTVVPRAKTYIYDTVVSTAKGYDYDDTTQVSVLRQGSRNSPCPDSLVTTYTHYDLDESVDTLRVSFTHLQCDGTYLFGGIERTATGTYTDTVVVDPFHVTISTLDLTINYSSTGDTAAVACDAFTWHGTTYTASAAPQHVYTNAAGCDSTVTLTLTVNYSNTGDTAAVACDAFTWHGVDYTASAAPQHVYTNAAGCDSTVTLALTVNYSNTGDTAAVACDAFTWHGTTYTASAAPQHVYTNAAGCDSTVTLTLTVNYSNTGDTAAVACDAFTWHGVDYTASAAPQHVYTNAAGCDSTVTLALTVNYSNTGDTAAVACDAFTWHGTTYTASAAPQHVYTNAAGCDSTVTLALTVNYSNTGTETADVCDEYTWQGTTYTVSNTTDQVVLTNVAGCDSTVTLNLTVRHSSVGDTAAVAFDAFTWYGHTYRATTTATHTLTNAEGCDSTVTLALTILESYSTDAAFGENGIEVEAYGYCAGPGAVRYRLSSGQPNEYRLSFAHAAFPAAGWTPITTPGSIDIEVPAGLATGDYSAVLQFRHSSWPELTSAALPVVIHVNLPETYVQPLFNDVIALVDTCQCLTDVQWYHREAGETEWTLIPGANDYYYHQEGGLTGEYFVSAKMNGVETYTCPQSDMGTLITDGNITLTAYPNPTASVVTLTLDGSRRASHEVRVLTTTGIELERLTFDGESLRMDLSAYPRGSYIVSVDGMAVRVIRN